MNEYILKQNKQIDEACDRTGLNKDIMKLGFEREMIKIKIQNGTLIDIPIFNDDCKRYIDPFQSIIVTDETIPLTHVCHIENKEEVISLNDALALDFKHINGVVLFDTFIFKSSFVNHATNHLEEFHLYMEELKKIKQKK